MWIQLSRADIERVKQELETSNNQAVGRLNSAGARRVQ